MPLSVLEILEIAREKNLVIKEGKKESIQELFFRVFGDEISVLPPDKKPETCYACGESYWWISKLDGHLYCAVCHPPATPDIVAGWRGKKKDPEDIKRTPAPQVDYQKPACWWCLSGKSLNCPDCRERR